MNCDKCWLDKNNPMGCDCGVYTYPEQSPPFMHYKEIKRDFIAKSKTARYLDISTNLNKETQTILDIIKHNSEWNIIYESMNLKASRFGEIPILIYQSSYNNKIIISLLEWVINDLTYIDNELVSITVYRELKPREDVKRREVLHFEKSKNIVTVEHAWLWNYTLFANSNEWSFDRAIKNYWSKKTLPISEIPVVFFLNNSEKKSDGYNLQQYFNYAEHVLKTVWNELDFTGAKVKATSNISRSPQDQDKIITRLRKGIVNFTSNFLSQNNMANEYIQTVPNQVDKHLLVLEWIDNEIDKLMGIEKPNAKKSAQETNNQMQNNNTHAYNLKKMEARIREYCLSRIFKIALEYEKYGNGNEKVTLPELLKVKIKLEREEQNGSKINTRPTGSINQPTN